MTRTVLDATLVLKGWQPVQSCGVLGIYHEERQLGFGVHIHIDLMDPIVYWGIPIGDVTAIGKAAPRDDIAWRSIDDKTMHTILRYIQRGVHEL